MKDKVLPQHVAAPAQWCGYTLDELRYEKLITLTCIEIEKERMMDMAVKTRNELPFVGQSGASALFHTVGKLDYIIFIIKLYRKLAPFFRKKKK